MPSILKGRLAGSAVLVLVVVCLVHASPGVALERLAAAENEEKSSKVAGRRKLHKPGEDPGPLPAPVEEMRQAILAASHSGNIDDLRVPLDWNELKPEVAAAQLLSLSYRPGVFISQVAGFIERADLPLSERSRAAQRLSRLNPARAQRSVTSVVAVPVLALFSVVVPWIAW